jgi:UDP-glucuronate 4-epimerase
VSTILVTGAIGLIGWKVSEFLLRDGHTVIGVDNLNDAYDVRLKEWRLSQLEGKPGFESHRLDIRDRRGLRSLFTVHCSRLGAVINLAARAGVRQSVENPFVYYETNVIGCLNLLEMCREFGVKKFVLASTSSLYGGSSPARRLRGEKGRRPERIRASQHPSIHAAGQPGTLARPLSEDDPTDRPLSPYAASKKAAEALCHTYRYLHGIDVTVPRYFTVYGPAGRPDMSLFRFVQRISEGLPITVYGDGRQSRDFTYVDDIARGTIAALKPVGYEIVNLGSDEPVVLMEAVRLIERLVERAARIEFEPRHPADVIATWADISKAGRLLGWRPTTKFEEGLAQLIVWYKANRAWAKDIRTD